MSLHRVANENAFEKIKITLRLPLAPAEKSTQTANHQRNLKSACSPRILPVPGNSMSSSFQEQLSRLLICCETGSSQLKKWHATTACPRSRQSRRAPPAVPLHAPAQQPTRSELPRKSTAGQDPVDVRSADPPAPGTERVRAPGNISQQSGSGRSQADLGHPRSQGARAGRGARPEGTGCSLCRQWWWLHTQTVKTH